MTNKIPMLLAEAERQSQSPDAEKSSLAQASRQFTTAAEAETNFERLKEKLFRIDRWNRESGVSHFELFDDNGNEIKDKAARQGDFIKITLPGTGKSDWVRIIAIDEAPAEVVLTVQPTYDPTEKTPAETVTSHFFTRDSQNNFCLERRHEQLNFYVIGLNEKSNTEDTNNILETARNFAAANLGHYLGFQTAEWTVFSRNFLEIEDNENTVKNE